MNAKFYKVKSFSVKDREYTVRHLPDGSWRCSCPKFVFQSRHFEEDCKHIKEVKKGGVKDDPR